MQPKNVQLILKDGEPEYAVLPYAEYQALLRRARCAEEVAPLACAPVSPPAVQRPAAADAPSPATDAPFDAADLVRLRKQRKLAQSQLAKMAKIGLMNLIQIETGQKEPAASVRADLARALEVEKL